MTQNRLILFCLLGSAALLGGAFAFQYIGGLAPCKMCLWQRWPHAIAVFLGLLALATRSRAIIALAALTVLVGAGIGFFHAGVELAWWEGPNTCTSGSTVGLSSEELLDQIMNAPLVRCDEVAWSLWGISMAGWNGILSLGLGGVWLWAIRSAR
jgi:disulfide bond formation protein DsbB